MCSQVGPLRERWTHTAAGTHLPSRAADAEAVGALPLRREGHHLSPLPPRTGLDRLPEDEQQQPTFGYSEAQYAFHSGNAWTHLEDAHRPNSELTRALDLYPLSDHTDRALVRLDQAMCAAFSGNPASAADQAMSTVVELPEEHRTALIIYRARDVADKVPEARRVLEMKALREILALPSE